MLNTDRFLLVILSFLSEPAQSGGLWHAGVFVLCRVQRIVGRTTKLLAGRRAADGRKLIMVSAVPSRTTSSIAFASRTGRGRPWLYMYVHTVYARAALFDPSACARGVRDSNADYTNPWSKSTAFSQLSFLFFLFCMLPLIGCARHRREMS